MSQAPPSARGLPSTKSTNAVASPTSARQNSIIGANPPSARRVSRFDAASTGITSTPRSQRGNMPDMDGPPRSARGAPMASARRASTIDMLTARNQSGNAMKVYVRVRPYSEREIAAKTSCHSTVRIDADNPSIISVLVPQQEYRPHETYSFTRCFWSVFDSTTEAEKEAVENVLHNSMPASARRPRNASMTQGPPSRRGSVLENVKKEPYVGAGSNPANLVESQVKHPPYAGQAEVYEHVGKPILANTLDGYNGCIFAYGQTGSGKTFTMMGYAPVGERRKSSAALPVTESPTSQQNESEDEEPDVVAMTNVDPRDMKGIIPRLCGDIFEGLHAKREEDSSLSYRIEVSYYEIFNEKVFDLIQPKNVELKIRNDPSTGPYVEGLTSKMVSKDEDVTRVISKGILERHTAATKYNDRSSRSHAILTFTITQFFLEQEDTMRMQSKLNLVDLAGSERTGKGGAEGLEKQTGININLSLTVLGRVIDCLADISQNKSLSVPVPYRDSNLTWLLSDSIGGNSQTSMVATISPHSINFEEMRQTLRYAARAKQVINRAKRNEDPQVRQIKMLTAEVERLQQLLKEAGGSQYTNEYVHGLLAKIKQLEKKVAEQERVIGGLRALLDAAGISDPTLDENYAEAVGDKAALQAKKTMDDLKKKLEQSQISVGQLKAELERRSNIEPEQLKQMKDQLSKQALLIAMQSKQLQHYKDLAEANPMEYVLTTVREKESIFFRECESFLLSSNVSSTDIINRMKVDYEREKADLRKKHQEELGDQAKRFSEKVKEAMDDSQKQQEFLKEKHKEALAQLEERLNRNKEVYEQDKKRIEQDKENLRIVSQAAIDKMKEQHKDELDKLRLRIEGELNSRNKTNNEVSALQEAHRREMDGVLDELERLKRARDTEVSRLKNMLEAEKARRESDLMEKDRQRRTVENEALDLRREILKLTSEKNKSDKDYEDQIRDLVLQQDQLIAVSNSVLGDWENKSTVMESDMCKLRALVYDQDYLNYRQKLRDMAFMERRDYSKDLEEVEEKQRREAKAMSELINRVKRLGSEQNNSLKKFRDAQERIGRTRRDADGNSLPPSPPPELTTTTTTRTAPAAKSK